MYNDTANGPVDKHPLELPEALGPIIHLQEKLFVPLKEYPDVRHVSLSHTHTLHICVDVYIPHITHTGSLLHSDLTLSVVSTTKFTLSLPVMTRRQRFGGPAQTNRS